jgi:hypothetical protein
MLASRIKRWEKAGRSLFAAGNKMTHPFVSEKKKRKE